MKAKPKRGRPELPAAERLRRKLEVRASDAQIAAWAEAAGGERQLSAWARAALDEAAQRNRPPTRNSRPIAVDASAIGYTIYSHERDGMRG